MIRRLLTVLALALLAYAFLPFVLGFEPLEKVSSIAGHYLERSPTEVGAGNTVTSVVVTYRGFDTLGEIVVLFAASCGVAILFGGMKEDEIASDGRKGPVREASEILCSASCFLMPMLILFGVYIFVHGHLSPGGGFQGGVIIASAFLLMFLTVPEREVHHGILGSIESLSGVSVIILGVLGIILSAGFLDPRYLPIGEYGRLLSAGAVPLIYSLIGLKVGSELTGVLDNMRIKPPTLNDGLSRGGGRRPIPTEKKRRLSPTVKKEDMK